MAGNIRTRLARLELANPVQVADALARERILARLDDMAAKMGPAPLPVTIAEVRATLAEIGYPRSPITNNIP